MKEQLQTDGDPLFLGLVTSTENRSAITGFEKAGFSKRDRFESKTFGNCWLMIYDAEQKNIASKEAYKSLGSERNHLSVLNR